MDVTIRVRKRSFPRLVYSHCKYVIQVSVSLTLKERWQALRYSWRQKRESDLGIAFFLFYSRYTAEGDTTSEYVTVGEVRCSAFWPITLYCTDMNDVEWKRKEIKDALASLRFNLDWSQPEEKPVPEDESYKL
jgi:hypothetical protein